MLALREFLRQVGEDEAVAEKVWERELRAYRDEKEFHSGTAWNAAH